MLQNYVDIGASTGSLQEGPETEPQLGITDGHKGDCL